MSKEKLEKQLVTGVLNTLLRFAPHNGRISKSDVLATMPLGSVSLPRGLSCV